VVAADGAVVHHDIPRPQRNCIPFLHLESILSNKRLWRMRFKA
jgi:hypothetical protein